MLCPKCQRDPGPVAAFCPFDGTSLDVPLDGPSASADPLIGRVLNGRYRVTARLGEGGMSLVYLAHHETLERDVALKVLRAALGQDTTGLARFAREARAAARVDHDNVVQTIDFGCAEDGRYYLVMEYVAGRSLREEITKAAPLPATRAMHVLAQVAAALDRAHTLGVVHRDLKPDNVMLCQRRGDHDFVKLLDFGLSKLAGVPDDVGAVTRVGEVFGTPEYMAPEQWNGEPAEAGVDLYAFGVMSYEMLAGCLPFEGNVMALATQHLLDRPVPPSQRVPNAAIPPALEALVMRCLEKKRGDRFGTASELLAALGAAWTQAYPRTRSSTYAATRAAPRALTPEQLPDPTLFQSSDLDVAWDGPALCAELGHLHALRRKRLVEIAEALWGAEPPPEVAALRVPIDEIEHLIDRQGHDIAVLSDQSAQSESAWREEEAALRLRVMEASLAAGIAHDRIPPVLRPIDALGETASESFGDSGVGSRSPAGADEGLNRAERRLAAATRRRQRERGECDQRLEANVHALRGLESQLGPLYEQLAATVRRAAARRPELRQTLVAFGQVDGAIATYQALLEAMQSTSSG